MWGGVREERLRRSTSEKVVPETDLSDRKETASEDGEEECSRQKSKQEHSLVGDELGWIEMSCGWSLVNEVRGEGDGD